MYTTKNWEAMVHNGVGSKHVVNPLPVTADEATVVYIQRRERDSYGEGFEGDSGGCYLVFQVGSRFFKKTFYESSYNEYDVSFWDEDIEEVFGEVKTVMTFAPKEC